MSVKISLCRAVIRQIVNWIAALLYRHRDLDQIAASLRRFDRLEHEHDPQDRPQSDGGAVRALGSGWLDWPWIEKPSGKKFGPKGYYRWRELDGRSAG